MTSTKHSPGPNDCPAAQLALARQYVADVNHELSVKARRELHPDEDASAYITTIGQLATYEAARATIANAKLLAATPDLLDALLEMEELLEHAANGEAPAPESTEYYAQRIEQVRAAIAKATA